MKRILVALCLSAGCAMGTALAAGETTTLQNWINTFNTWMTSAKASIASQASLITALTTRVAATEATTAAQGARLTAAEGALAAQAGQIATLQAQVAALGVAPVPVPIPIVTPPYDPQVQWRAGMEGGTLAEWSEKVNTGAADSVAVTAAAVGIPPKGGSWVMQQSVSGTGGTRMHRYPEVDPLSRAGTTFYWSWWVYYPTKISFGPSDMFMLWQTASADAAGVGQPIWGLYFNGSNSTLILGWNPTGAAPAEGPHAGESGPKAYTSAVPVPVAQWVFFEVMIKPAGDFTGAIKLWMNGQVIFDQSLVKTRFPYVGLAGYTYATQNAYGSGLTPVPAVHYVDDVTVSLGRMP